MVCIYCNGKVVKYGLYNHKEQRYRCLRCTKTFGDRTIANLKAKSNKRLVLHLALAGCIKSEIATELQIEEGTVDEWLTKYLKNIKVVLPSEPLLSIQTLIIIYKAIEKSRVSKLHSRGRRRPRR